MARIINVRIQGGKVRRVRILNLATEVLKMHKDGCKRRRFEGLELEADIAWMLVLFKWERFEGLEF